MHLVLVAGPFLAPTKMPCPTPAAKATPTAAATMALRWPWLLGMLTWHWLWMSWAVHG